MKEGTEVTNPMRLGRRALAPLLIGGAVLLGGCFDEPEIEDRWTRFDIDAASVVPGQVMPPGRDSITVSAARALSGTDPLSWRLTTSRVLASRRSCSVSPTQMIATQPSLVG